METSLHGIPPVNQKRALGKSATTLSSQLVLSSRTSPIGMASGQRTDAKCKGSFAVSLKKERDDTPHALRAELAGRIPPKSSMTMTFGADGLEGSGGSPCNALLTAPVGKDSEEMRKSPSHFLPPFPLPLPLPCLPAPLPEPGMKAPCLLAS